MSGGHWNYLEGRLTERARSGSGIGAPSEVWRLMAALERELDWGYSGDTCLRCAEIRCAKALASFFNTECEDATIAIAVARDGQQNLCAECAQREAAR